MNSPEIAALSETGLQRQGQGTQEREQVFPVEILLKIFAFLVDPRNRRSPFSLLPEARALIRAGRSCKHFWNVIQGSKDLLGRIIDIDSCPPEIAQVLLKRSYPHPITFVSGGAATEGSTATWLVVLSAFERCDYFTTSVNASNVEAVNEVLRRRAPRLEHFTLASDNPSPPNVLASTHDSMFRGHFPRLRTFQLCGPVFLDERLLPFAIPTPNLAHINIHGGREWLQFSPLNSSWHPPLLDRPAFHIEAWLRRLDSVAPHLTTLRLAGVFITLSRSLEDTIHLPTLQELAIGGDLRCCTVLLSALKIFPSCSTRIDAVVSYYRARERSETVAMWKAVAATILSASQNHVFTLKIGWEFVVQLWDHRPMPHFQFSLGFTKDIWPNPELYVDFVDLCDWLMVQLDDLVDRGELVVENVRVLKLDVPVNLPLHDLEGLELLLRKMARVPEVHFARFPAALWRRLNHHIHDGSEDLCVSYLIPSVTKIVVFACDESNNDSPQLLRVLGYLLDRQSNPQVTRVQECVIQHGPSWSLGLQAATVYENISRASQLTALAELVCDLTITSASLADLKTWIDPQLEVAANIAENVLIV